MLFLKLLKPFPQEEMEKQGTPVEHILHINYAISSSASSPGVTYNITCLQTFLSHALASITEKIINKS